MSERGGRLSRVSPSPGKGASIAYTLCPANDPDTMTTNVLTIPLSAITLSSSTHSSGAAAGIQIIYIKKNHSFFF